MFVVYLFETHLFQVYWLDNILIYCFKGRSNKNLPLLQHFVVCDAAFVTYLGQNCTVAALTSASLCVTGERWPPPPRHPTPAALLLISSRRKPYFGEFVSGVHPGCHCSRSPRFPYWSNCQIIGRSNTVSPLCPHHPPFSFLLSLSLVHFLFFFWSHFNKNGSD